VLAPAFRASAGARPAIRRLTAAGIPSVNVPGSLPVFADEAVRESVLSVTRPGIG
jgi:ABC-type sugar transport system substrate-binding protein